MVRNKVTQDDMVRMSPDEKLKRVDFFVEANRFAIHELWSKYYGSNNKADKLEWIQDMSGFGRTVGYINNSPVSVEFSFYTIGDRFVCFYYATSRFVDWNMITEYLDKNWPVKYDNDSRRARTDAENFHNCYNFCKEQSFENIDAIDKKWFIAKFNEISEVESNGESVENVKFNKTESKLTITFAVNADRYGLHRDNNIVITKDKVRMNLAEVIDGGDLHYCLKEAIEEKIK